MISMPIWVFVAMVLITIFILGFVVWYEISELIEQHFEKKNKQTIRDLELNLSKKEPDSDE